MMCFINTAVNTAARTHAPRARRWRDVADQLGTRAIKRPAVQCNRRTEIRNPICICSVVWCDAADELKQPYWAGSAWRSSRPGTAAILGWQGVVQQQTRHSSPKWWTSSAPVLTTNHQETSIGLPRRRVHIRRLDHLPLQADTPTERRTQPTAHTAT